MRAASFEKFFELRGGWRNASAEPGQRPRCGELAEELERRTTRRAVRNARAGLREPLELADEKLDRAVREWVAGYQALLGVLRRREDENASDNAQ